jgi:hypothetical protein
MIKGIFRFIQDGQVVAEGRNLLTTEGKKIILRYLAGQRRVIGDTLAVGVGTSAAAISDETLDFEFQRAAVTVVSPDFDNSLIIFKGTLPVGAQGEIREAGLWSQADSETSGPFVSRLLFTFDEDTESWSVGTYTSDAERIGGDSLAVTATASTTTSTEHGSLAFDFSGYSDTELIKLSYYVNNSNCSSIVIRLKTDDSNYYSYTISTPSSGHHIFEFDKSGGSATGTPDWSSIAEVELRVTATGGGSTTVDFDAMRVEDTDSLNPEYVLISRTVLGSPLQKTIDKQMDIEYTWEITI